MLIQIENTHRVFYYHITELSYNTCTHTHAQSRCRVKLIINSRLFFPFQMVQAIQVLRFHLLELEKVRIQQQHASILFHRVYIA